MEETLNLEHATAKTVRSAFKRKEKPASRSTEPRAVLQEVFQLMEEYGPIWYTEDLHNRIQIALSEHKVPDYH
jgi:hypothetical protein